MVQIGEYLALYAKPLGEEFSAQICGGQLDCCLLLKLAAGAAGEIDGPHPTLAQPMEAKALMLV
jgi:hypothetical protein